VWLEIIRNQLPDLRIVFGLALCWMFIGYFITMAIFKRMSKNRNSDR
jgi:hypothetical protein